MIEPRIIALEEKFAHQDYLVEQLNKIVTDQQLIIDQLKKDVMELKLSQNSAANQAGTRTLKDDVPPHY